VPIYLRPSRADPNCIPPRENNKSPVKRLLGVSSAVDKLTSQRGQARTPADGKPTLQFVFHPACLLHEFLAALALALSDSVHGRSQENTDGFVDMCFCGNG
jgi:hypothetical protein